MNHLFCINSRKFNFFEFFKNFFCGSIGVCSKIVGLVAKACGVSLVTKACAVSLVATGLCIKI